MRIANVRMCEFFKSIIHPYIGEAAYSVIYTLSRIGQEMMREWRTVEYLNGCSIEEIRTFAH